MPAFRWSALPQGAVDAGQSSARGATFSGEKIAVARYVQPAGSAVPPHARPCEQVHAIVRGRARYRVGGEERDVGPGDGILFPANVEHGAKIVEDYTTLNCKDIVPGWSVYHARWER